MFLVGGSLILSMSLLLHPSGIPSIIEGLQLPRNWSGRDKFGLFESKSSPILRFGTTRSAKIAAIHNRRISLSDATLLRLPVAVDITGDAGQTNSDITKRLLLADMDPGTTKLAIGVIGPFLSSFGFLFILRIVMSWYPKRPMGEFPYVIACALTEPFLSRKVIPPLARVDVTPVVWFGLLSFLNEILVGPQGLLVLLSQKVS